MTGKIFVSYSHTDAAVANQIVDKLKANGFTPWIDQQEIKPGQSFIAGMNAGLAEASYVMVLFSEAAAKSDWVSREWMAAMAGKVPLLPVLLEGGQLPPLLKDVVYFDLRGDTCRGIATIAEFFASELRPVQTSTSRNVTDSPLKTANRRQLRLVAAKCLDDTQLNAFCFDAEIDVKNLEGASVQARILSLLHQVLNDGLTTQLANWMLVEKRRCVENQIKQLKDEGGWDWDPAGR